MDQDFLDRHKEEITRVFHNKFCLQVVYENIDILDKKDRLS